MTILLKKYTRELHLRLRKNRPLTKNLPGFQNLEGLTVYEPTVQFLQ